MRGWCCRNRLEMQGYVRSAFELLHVLELVAQVEYRELAAVVADLQRAGARDHSSTLR